MRAAELRTTTYRGVLTILAVLSLSLGDYMRRGSDITDCSMKCMRTDGVLELYRQCGGEETRLLELWCESMWSGNHYEPKLQLNPDSGCWTLTDAEKDDSCVYNVVYYGEGGRILKTLHITVLDPVLISSITSNSSRLGQDIAVSVQFSGEATSVTWEVDGGPIPHRYRLTDDNRTLIIPSAQRDDGGRRLRVRITNPISEETREYQQEITDLGSISSDPGSSSSDPGSSRPYRGVIAALVVISVLVIVIVLLVKHPCYKMKPMDVDRNEIKEHSKKHEQVTICSSEKDPPEAKVKTGVKTFFFPGIYRIWKKIWKIPKYEESKRRRGGAEPMDDIPVTHTECSPIRRSDNRDDVYKHEGARRDISVEVQHHSLRTDLRVVMPSYSLHI